MKSVKGGLVVHPKQDQQAAGQSNGKPRDVYESIDPILLNAPVSDDEIISQHVAVS
jgi:hypothetical protein